MNNRRSLGRGNHEDEDVMRMTDRDKWGKIVRDAWIKWAMTQENPKASWLVPYDDLSEPDKEADRQIAEAVLQAMAISLNQERLPLAEKISEQEYTKGELNRFKDLQEAFFGILGQTTREQTIYE